MVVRRAELDDLPSQSIVEFEEARSASADLRAMITRGLGIKIPVDIALNRRNGAVDLHRAGSRVDISGVSGIGFNGRVVGSGG